VVVLYAIAEPGKLSIVRALSIVLATPFFATPIDKSQVEFYSKQKA
jgi:hypothetical protein